MADLFAYAIIILAGITFLDGISNGGIKKNSRGRRNRSTRSNRTKRYDDD